jgi:hypothetical protein
LEATSDDSTEVFVAWTHWDKGDAHQHSCVLTASGPLLGEFAQVNGLGPDAFVLDMGTAQALNAADLACRLELRHLAKPV